MKISHRGSVILGKFERIITLIGIATTDMDRHTTTISSIIYFNFTLNEEKMDQDIRYCTIEDLQNQTITDTWRFYNLKEKIADKLEDTKAVFR